jgi:hypothetical protein
VSLAHNPVNILFCVLFIFFNESTVGDSPPVFIQKKEHDDGLVINLRDNILFVAETLDELPEGLSHLLHDVGQVPNDSWSLTGGPEVVDELSA